MWPPNFKTIISAVEINEMAYHHRKFFNRGRMAIGHELNIYYEVGLCRLQDFFQPCNFVICISAEAHDIMVKI